MKPVRYGIIGTGQMGRGHTACLKQMESARLVAGADPHEESLAAFREKAGPSVETYDSYRQLLERDDVEAVVIATPDYTHVDIVLDALVAGKHVLSEKPAATSVRDLSRLEEAVRRSPQVYQVGLECRYLPVFQRMKKAITSGEVGAPRMLWCHEFRGPFLHKVGDWILFQEKTGGVFVEKTCHYFDLMTWFAGANPKRVSCFAGQDVVKEIYGVQPDIFDNGWAIIEYENGARGNLGLCMFAINGGDIEMGVLGDAGRMIGHFSKQEVQVWDYATASHTTVVAKPPRGIEKYSHNGGVYLEHLEFVECIRTGRKPLTGLEEARFSTLVGLAAEESARSGGGPITL